MKEFDVTPVGRGSIRLDLVDPTPDDPLLARFCRVIDLRDAYILSIQLMQAIKVAEIEAAQGKRRKQK